MATTLNKMSLGEKVEREFARIAFAEAGELYPEHPHKVRSVTEVFSEVAFAESGEDYRVDVESKTPPKVCRDNETSGGLCV